MSDIKLRIIEILEQGHHTFAELADYLQLSEEQLTEGLSQKTLELRQLENISKALRVPLYSFFRSGPFVFDSRQKPVYINELWTGDDKTKSREKLVEEIALLRQIIELKQERLKAL